jgi:hypothetical protein
MKCIKICSNLRIYQSSNIFTNKVQTYIIHTESKKQVTYILSICSVGSVCRLYISVVYKSEMY